ncbi:MAG: o-succinylbenzoate--CoA ligase [Sedimenticola thiotaurini]|uniref:O-succinylbenzoate--CoA ligase n=1 Tax=Sedimenticola thiotaurini TaxID=1543721 RepID=A0A558DAI1_9GAMM|nr:MAG: o-succinylbenzoate--CoA ligase [Sedimenticola thiotaurini]
MNQNETPGQWLSRGQQLHPNIPALEGDRFITYAHLFDVSARLAHRLSSQGLRRGQIMAVQLDSTWQLAHLLYAALQLGVTFLPLDPRMELQRCRKLLSQVGCHCLISDQLMSAPGLQMISPVELFNQSSKVSVHFQLTPLDAAAIQLIIATSGTTGDPKGVMLSGANLAASAAASEARLGLGRGDSWLACLPLFHIGGLSILLRCLAVGAKVLLQEGFDAAKVWEQIAKGAVTHISLVPAMLDRLLQQAGDEHPPAALRVVLIGGGPLSGSLAERAHAAGWPLCVSYGMSETASQFATDAGPDAGLAPGLVGLPLDGYEVIITADGRIRVRGAAVMAGYANPEGELDRGLDQGWFETGDLGSLDGQGRLTVTGRADDLLVSGGKNIHPVEVEEQLMRCPGISSVGVTGRADPVWGVILVALYSGEFSVEQLRGWAADNLPGHLRPREYIQIDQLPLNQMGKLSRSALKQMLESAAGDSSSSCGAV